jgi:glyoxylase-like metal-dependent hydrolase (beta-lactamase superfamily II)
VVTPPYHFKVGQFECIVIACVDEPADMEIMKRRFPQLPVEQMEQAVRESGAPIKRAQNILYIRTPEHQLLVDTGEGEDPNPLLEGLAQVGIQREQIDGVIITHCDVDHIGGITMPDGSLTFPNAHYDIWKTEWDNQIDQAEKSDDPQHIARRNLFPIRDRVSLIDQETEIAPGISMLPMPGHKVGHSGLLLESEGERLLHIVDAAHHPMQLAHPDWSVRFDIDPELAAETRKAMFERAAQENLLVMTYHFAFPGLGYIKEHDGVLRWEAVGV